MECMEKQAILQGKRILCPYCKKMNGQLTGQESVKNFRIRCRGSSGRQEHFFILNVEREVEND